MTAASLVAPMCAYTLLLFAIWMLVGYVRVSGVSRGAIAAEYLRVGAGPRPADKIVDIHHHFSNQFEMPVLFYLGCIAVLATDSIDHASVILAWSFVGIRTVHTAIVLIKNNPMIRVGPYVFSGLAVWAIWGNLFLRVVWSGA